MCAPPHLEGNTGHLHISDLASKRAFLHAGVWQRDQPDPETERELMSVRSLSGWNRAHNAQPEHASLRRDASAKRPEKARPHGEMARLARSESQTLQARVVLWIALLLFLTVRTHPAHAQANPLPGSPSAPAQGQPNLPTPAPAGTVVTPETQATQSQQAAAQASSVASANWSLSQWRGLRINAIQFEGVTFTAEDELPNILPVKQGQPLDPTKVTDSIRRLFATGLYRNLIVDGTRQSDGVTLIFVGTPSYFVGRVEILGVNNERLTSLLNYATKLDPGAAFVDTQIQTGIDGIRQSLANNGYFQPVVKASTTIDPIHKQVNVTYTVAIGPQARVGNVVLDGKDPGFSPTTFQKKAKLKKGSKVTNTTVSNALQRIRKQYQKENRLEATATLEDQTYAAPRKQLDYKFGANQGPLVKVDVEGAKLSKSRIKLLVPIYEEGTIDNDLLNEGSFNIKDYLFQTGYFDAAVQVKVVGANTSSESVVFSVDKGVKHKVVSVDITGNHYFQTEILQERMQVQKADLYMRSGRYSPQIMKSDTNSIEALYKANGFDKVSVTPSVRDVDTDASGNKLKIGQIFVTVKIVEGPQEKFGNVTLTGIDAARQQAVKAMMSSQQGQPFSLSNVADDRDAILGYYVSHGFDQARVEVRQTVETKDTSKVDVNLNVTEGEQSFVDNVLLSGIVHTKPKIVQNQIGVHSGDPLNESALLDSQRKLYDLALFNQVVADVQNPQGDDTRKNVLIQITEARRWDVTYGFGFEAETGTPQTGNINPASAILLGLPPNAQYSQNGKTGVSPRVSLDVSRINLRGTDESLTLHSTYGLLEEVAQLTFQNPRFFGHTNLSNAISGGYSNVQNITTFQASTLQGDLRFTQKWKRTDTFIYDFQYRRVAVNPATLQVSANLIPQLSQPVRVGGPGLTWFHDRRDPSPLNATKGWYFSAVDFLADSHFGSQVTFDRLDTNYSSYYSWGTRHVYTLARNTRIGVIRSWGSNPNATSQSCNLGDLIDTNASCDAVPLPERLYAGGATSHRGFGINDAGPRDLQTGYPVGGNAVFVNQIELRMPPPTLPFVGNSLNFVLFEDMGNVFSHVADMFPSFARFHQPNQSTCATVGTTSYGGAPPVSSTYPFGTCDFNYFSHAVGLGLRYNTPVGPIRVDFSYNLNPPVYPVIYDFNGSTPYEGQAGHFNFFFSIGQAF